MKRTLLRLVILAFVIISSAAIAILVYKNITGNSKSVHLFSVEKIEQMGKLVLVRIIIKDILTQTKKRPFYLPDATALLLVVGEVSAGIDLSKVKKEDIVASETQISIKLPSPEILMSKINHNQSMVYDVKWGGWSQAQLVDEAYRTAEPKIINAAKAIGYEETCKNSARALLTAMFGESSGKKIVIDFKK